MKTIDDIENAREQLGFDTDAFLRESGWKDTSSTPGCLWLWTREWEGKTIMVDRDTALSMCSSTFGPYADYESPK